MVPEKSSSNRVLTLHGVRLQYRDRCVGRVRLPINRHEDFILDFNRTYGEIDMHLEPVQEVDKKKSPES